MLPFQEILKGIYQTQNKIGPLIEGLEGEFPQQTLDDCYVKLETIIKEDNYRKKDPNGETISRRKQEVEVKDFFGSLPNEGIQNQPINNRVLILGDAGSGKTTLRQIIAYKWSKGELWNDKFDYVYKISLKTLLNKYWDRSYDNSQKEDDILKCFVHYHVVAGLKTEERKRFKLGDIAWYDKRDRILLLLDGYDEVTNEKNGDYSRLFEDMLNHPNIILTSRQNAIDKVTEEKFGRIIENIGFDNCGIKQYLTWYFKNDKNKGLELEEFLEKQPKLKEICHIPIIIAMMCFIWSQGDSNQALYKVSNWSDLYCQMVDHLGFRHYTKKPENQGRSQEELSSRWKGGEIRLIELRVLQHIAYKRMTDGSIEMTDDQRFLLPGMTKKRDTEDISIQSSINSLKINSEITIIDVYKYGLLKPEGILPSEKEPSETDLLSHTFCFVHRSFQEFLAAQYLSEKLMEKDNEEQEKIANFIAFHRNEPLCQMTWKFMAGILSAEKGEKAERALKIFWDTIMCNADGTLEFGVETKVILLMDLLSQAIKEEKIDGRIPNINIAKKLIDGVVLSDLSGWKAQLKKSGYTSENIKESLIKYLLKNDVNWLSEKSFELQKQLNPKIKNHSANSHPSLEDILEIISFMFNRFSKPQKNEIFLRVCDILKDYHQEKWRLIEKAIELILIYCRTQFKFEVQNEKQVLDLLDLLLTSCG